MKKVFSLFTVLSLVLCFSGCNSNPAAGGNGATVAPSSNSKLEIPKLTGPKRKIAVLKFEDRAPNHWYKYDLGQGMSDMLVTELVKSNNFIVIEREMLDKILDEQKLGQTGLLSPNAATKVGKLLGVSAIVAGGITEFGVKDSGGRVGGWALGAATGGLVSGLGMTTYTARVAVDARMIDTSTGEIIMADTASDEQSDSKIDFDSWSAPDVSFGSNNFNDTLIGKATRNAINNLVAKISISIRDKSSSGNTGPWKGYVLKADGNDVWINAGSDSGIKQGLQLSIMSKGEEIEDAEGQHITIPGSEVATAEVIQVLPKLSKVKILTGGKVVKDMEVIAK